MRARPANSIPSRTATTGEPAISRPMNATPMSAPPTSATVVLIGVNTSAAMGATTAALVSTQSDGLSRSRNVALAPAGALSRAVFCITLDE